MAYSQCLCSNRKLIQRIHSSARWTQWIQRFNTYLVASNVKDTARKRALLLHQAGPEVHEIFKTLPDTGDEKNYEATVNALTAYFEAEKIESIKHICLDKHLNKIMKPSTNFTHA
jgi:hypothetical protein